jgi:nitrite reductase/ring-hydroxylating ferredoxin subunit
MAEWVTVDSAGELGDGELNSFSAGERQVAIANVDGTLHAFDDLCTHQQCSLAEGDLTETIVECPCHGSQFDVTTGERLRGPAVRGVRTYAVSVENGVLQV